MLAFNSKMKSDGKTTIGANSSQSSKGQRSRLGLCSAVDGRILCWQWADVFVSLNVQEFRWQPIVNESMLEVYKSWLSSKSNEWPKLIITGSATVRQCFM